MKNARVGYFPFYAEWDILHSVAPAELTANVAVVLPNVSPPKLGQVDPISDDPNERAASKNRFRKISVKPETNFFGAAIGNQ
ncbi:hypothetical protein NKH81_34430 [Mesorhizobium sp. M0959]|uniref:hypothetical protein n=1 Tax=Mesorhizobium sp. M0959 TaxID=2957034 RepID=UPI003339FB9C